MENTLHSATPEDYGALGDGVTDDTAAIQGAVDAVSPGGTVNFRGSATYNIAAAVILKSGVAIEGNGATVTKTASATGAVTFANEMYSKGYGGGGRDITIRNLRTVGDYAVTGAGRDQVMSFMHVRGLRIENCVFEQGMVNGHYLDLLGCDDVRITNSTFRGMNPLPGREIIEAIQTDSATYSGAGHGYFGLDFFDGLPTRNVRVTGCTFTTLEVGGIEYPLPNPLGMHSGALVGDDGWYQDIWFENNLVRGWTKDVAGNPWQGWLHMAGFRNVVIRGNTFAYAGPTQAVGRGSVIASRPLTEVIPLGQAAAASPVKEILTKPRAAMNWKISDNIFTGFNANYSDGSSSLIYMNAPGNDRISITGNVSESVKCGFCRVDNDQNLVISANTVEGSGTNHTIDVRSASAVIQGNSIRAASSFGIHLYGGQHHLVEGNRIQGGYTSIRAIGVGNGILANNYLRDYSGAGIDLGANSDPATTFDVTVSGNRIASSKAGVVASIKIGTKSTRTFRFGNRYWDGGPILDSGNGTRATSALDTN
ncbi:hypothetical protein G7068_11015 [Leucobacter viscericola]|uniref:Pectate lyase superfamily protein n=1 Tax=Leucobacter viscericola TaxID=2714935 RepID=A0A6G7XGS0_9MICO|nr:right-handed parallel beta-helix repeat-containing protein [Leucobacter viscericola]QIK63666.1 hypothetical protein G7068_11015 [Leucobacter viscericola]